MCRCTRTKIWKVQSCLTITQPLTPWGSKRPNRGRLLFGNETPKNLPTRRHILCVMIFSHKLCHPKRKNFDSIWRVCQRQRLKNIHFPSLFYCAINSPHLGFYANLSLVFYAPNGFCNCQIVRINKSIKYKQHLLQTESNLVQDSKIGFGGKVKVKSG